MLHNPLCLRTNTAVNWDIPQQTIIHALPK
jgi:hypothetical protein